MYFPSRPDGPAAQCCHSCQRQLLARNPRMRPTTQLPTYWLTRFGWKYLGTSPTSLMGKLPLGIERAHLHPPLQPAASGGIPHCPPNHTAWSVTPCKRKACRTCTWPHVCIDQPLAFRPISYLMPWQDSYPLLVPTPSGLPHLPHGAWAHSSERLSSTAWAYQPVSFGLVF